MAKQKSDRIFLIIISLLIVVGSVIFFSASQSLLGREGGADYKVVAIKQFSILIIGLLALLLVANINYKKYRPGIFWAFILSVILCLAVFIPEIGFRAKGANRWIEIGQYTFQPSDFLKLTFVFYWAYWLASVKEKITTMKFGFLPFLVITAIPTAILFLQKDTGTLMVIFATGTAMFIMAGGRWKHVLYLAIGGLIGILILAQVRPHVKDRLITFMHPEQDTQGAGYQINQSLIAIGSGQMTGRGFGQSVQKFNYLPEAMGDSIFAVISEEFGFIGSTVILLLFAIFTLWGLRISARINDGFGRLLCGGLVLVIASQSFINMAAMMGLIPLTGVPLVFISQGGSALIIALIECGIILNISRFQTA